MAVMETKKKGRDRKEIKGRERHGREGRIK
jgi:hypothetical protein